MVKKIVYGNELYKKGMSIRRSVLGDDHFNKAEAIKTDFANDFQEYITSYRCSYNGWT